VSDPTIRRRLKKGHGARRWLWNQKPPAGRLALRAERARLEALVDPTRFDRALSLSIDRCVVALESRE
jgi:hypothetical protein